MVHLIFERVLPIGKRIKALSRRTDSDSDAVELGKLQMHGLWADAPVFAPGQAFLDRVGGLAIGGQAVVPSGDVLRLIRTNAMFSTRLTVFVEPTEWIASGAIVCTKEVPVGGETLVLAQGSATAENKRQRT